MSEQGDPSRWRRVVQFSNDLADFAKLGALVLAVAGFLALYFPGARRALEVHVVGADSYYNIGLLVGAPGFDGFRPRNIYSPLWDPRLGALDRMMRLRDSVVFTVKDEPTVGREAAAETARVRTLAAKGTCLYVKDVVFRPYRRERYEGATEGLRVSIPSEPGAAWSKSLSAIETEAARAGATPAKVLRDSLPADFKRTCSADPLQGPALCPRISVWIEARKVTC
ncbi:hypothetical protein BH10PSE5_BH10PSE5_28470 [soil metagenome]